MCTRPVSHVSFIFHLYVTAHRSKFSWTGEEERKREIVANYVDKSHASAFVIA